MDCINGVLVCDTISPYFCDPRSRFSWSNLCSPVGRLTVDQLRDIGLAVGSGGSEPHLGFQPCSLLCQTWDRQAVCLRILWTAHLGSPSVIQHLWGKHVDLSSVHQNREGLTGIGAEVGKVHRWPWCGGPVPVVPVIPACAPVSDICPCSWCCSIDSSARTERGGAWWFPKTLLGCLWGQNYFCNNS